MKVNVEDGAADEQENVDVLEIDFRIAIEMIRSGEIKDVKTIMLLQFTQNNNLP